MYHQEGLPIDENLFKVNSVIPTVRLYGCKKNCPMTIYIGDSILPECPLCGSFMEVINKNMLDLTDEIFRDELKKYILAQGHYRFGVKCLQEIKMNRALRAFSRAIELKPDFIDAYHNLSAVRGMLDDPRGAVQDCCRVIRLNPKDNGAYYNRGSAKAQLGDYEGAIADITMSLSLGYDKPLTYLKRGMLLVQSLRFKEAESDLIKFIQLDPSSTHSDLAREMLKKISITINEDQPGI